MEQSNLQALFSNPNFISLLAGVGQRLDPQGVGGALGGATIDYQKAKSAQEAAAAITARNAPPTNTVLTPAGVPGPTSETTTRNADGTYSTTIKGDTGETVVAPGTATVPPVVTQPTPTTTPTLPTSAAPQAASRTRMSELPFSLAPTQGPLDFRGLSADQIPQILQMYHEGERLRQANVGQILSAYDQESVMGVREAVTAIHQETIAQMQRLAPFDVPKVQAEIRRVELAGDVSKLEAESLSRRAPYEIGLVKAELAARQATASAQRAAAGASTASSERSTQLMRQERELFDINEPAARAAAALYKEKDPISGQEYTIPGSAIPQFLVQRQTALATAQERRIDNARQAEALKLSAIRDERKLRETVVEAETKINLNNRNAAERLAVSPYVDLYNELSEMPYVYVYFPDEWGGGKYDNVNAKIDLPPVQEQRVSARDVYEAAIKHPGGPMTVKQYLETEFFPNKIGRPAPWLPQK